MKHYFLTTTSALALMSAALFALTGNRSFAQDVDPPPASQEEATDQSDQETQEQENQEQENQNDAADRQDQQQQSSEFQQQDPPPRPPSDQRNQFNEQPNQDQQNRNQSELNNQDPRNQQGQRAMRGEQNRDQQFNQNRQDQYRQDQQRFDQRDPRSDNRSNQRGDSTRFQGGANANARFDQRNLTAGLEFGRQTADGLVISNIQQDSFFYDSGLRPGDVILAYDGRPIDTRADFERWVVYEPGQQVPVVVLRDGREETIYVTFEQQQQQRRFAPSPQAGAYLGVTLDRNVPNAAVVRAVQPGSPADQAGLRRGDMIVALNGYDVSSWNELVQIVGSMQPGQNVEIEFSRLDRTSAILAGNPNQLPPNRAYVRENRFDSRVQPAQGYANPGEVRRAEGSVIVEGEQQDRVFRRGDTDRDGRLLDGDGRAPRRGGILPRIRD